ncbi:MAG: endonuclease/exonuclease/phosphatase family protein [Candidatus Scatosoma sp.]
MKNKTAKKIALSFLCVLLALLLAVVSYAAYVLLSYSRIEDNLVLQPEPPLSGGIAEPMQTGQTYTVTTYNIGFGAYTPEFTFFMDGGKESRAASEESVITHVTAAAETAKGFSPDFALFQEADTSSTRSYHVNEKQLIQSVFAEYCGVFAVNYHSAYLMYPVFKPHGKSNSGIYTLSRYNVTSALRRSLPVSTGLSKLLDLDRCYSVSRVPTANGKEFVLYNVHLSAYGGSEEIRSAQMNMLFSDMKSEYGKGNYCVAGGDFNHDFTGNSAAVLNGEENAGAFEWAQPFPAELLPEGVSRAVNYTCGTQQPTCRNCDVPYKEGNYTVIVDGFLHTANVNVSYLENVQLSFADSDHNPVLMRFSLQG